MISIGQRASSRRVREKRPLLLEASIAHTALPRWQMIYLWLVHWWVDGPDI
jgi:hypothetical protein